jgi:hypothetical protein
VLSTRTGIGRYVLQHAQAQRRHRVARTTERQFERIRPRQPNRQRPAHHLDQLLGQSGGGFMRVRTFRLSAKVICDSRATECREVGSFPDVLAFVLGERERLGIGCHARDNAADRLR